jgi:uncharacterized protein with PQ loop repeat
MNLEFREIQKFRKWWHFLIAGSPVIIVFVLSVLVQFDVLQTKNQQKDPIVFSVIILFLLAIVIWFFSLKLETIINGHGIYVNYKGLLFCKRSMTWGEIKSISLIKYDPLSDYGGWGVKYSITGNGWCYNVSGNDGIKIITNNGKPFLIGTQRQEEVEKIIQLYFK